MSRRGWLAALVIVALVVRLAVVFATPGFSPLEDSASYDADAVQLVTSGTFPGSLQTLHAGPTAFYPPLFPIALAGVDEIVGVGHGRWEAGRLLEAGLGAVAVWLIGLIGLRLWPGRPRTGLIATGLAAIYPPLVLVGSSLLSESLFIPLVLGAVWSALVFRSEPRLRWALAAGLCVGLAGLTRGNGILLAIPIGWLVYSAPARPVASRWRTLGAPAVVALVAVLTLVPWTVRNADVFHRFVPVSTDTGYTLAGTFNPQVQSTDQRYPAMWQMPESRVQALYAANPHATEASVSDTLTSQALHYIRAHPSSVLETAYWNTVRMLDLTPSIERLYAPYERYPTWLAMLSVYTFWLLGLLAVAGIVLRRARGVPWAVWGCPLILYLSGVLMLGLTRGRSPLDPFLILIASVTLDAAWDRWSAHRPAGAVTG